LRLVDQAPVDLFRAAFRHAHGCDPTDAQDRLFRLASESA
jgi:hypothetical protein